MEKKIIKKIISFALCAALAFSLIPLGSIIKDSGITAYAADNSYENDDSSSGSELAPGTYVAALYRNSVYGNSGTYHSLTKYYPQAILTVDEEQNQYLTIGIWNWSYYDAFITLKQKYTDAYGYDYNYVPEQLLDKFELTEEEAFRNNYSQYIIEATDENQDYYNYEPLEIELDETLDVAYVTFEIEDYTKPIWCMQWVNKRLSNIKSQVQYHDASMIWLEQDTLYSVDSLKEAIEDGTANLALRHANSDTAAHDTIANLASSTVSKFFKVSDSSVEKTGEDEYAIKLYINDRDSISAQRSMPEKFKLLTGKSNENYAEDVLQAWHTYPGNTTSSLQPDTTSTFEDVEIRNDDGGDYIVLTYTEKELLFGRYVYFNSSFTSLTTGSVTDSTYQISPVATMSEPIREITITSDEYSDVKIYSNTSALSEDTTLEVIRNSASYDYGYTSGLYSESVWYTLNLKNGDTTVWAKQNPKVEIKLPEGCDESNTYLETRNSNGTRVTFNLNSNNVDYENGTWTISGTSVNGCTYAVCRIADSINPAELEDGIYKVGVYLEKSSETDGTPSMANDALVHEAYIVREGDKTTLYFRACAMDSNGFEDLYIGELHCAGFNDNTIYTSYLTDADGKLVDNAGFDAVTEYACITGGIIELEPDCWVEGRTAYRMTIASPMMAAIGGSEYDEIKDDELGVLLVFSNASKLEDEDLGYKDYKTYLIDQGFGFDRSALRRQIDFSKTYEEDLYTTESWNELLSALELAQTVYENTSAGSDDIEEQINILIAARAALVVDESAVGDKTQLQALVDAAKAIAADNYTNSSFNALQTAITLAESTLEKEAVKQSKVDEQTVALQAAIDALEKKPETTLDKDNLADGKYILTAEMIKTDRNSYSMSNNGINHTVWLEVIDGEYYLTVQFKGLAIYNKFGYLMNLSYYDSGYSYGEYGNINGTLVLADVISTQKNSDGSDVIDQYNDEDNLYPELLRIRLVDKASEQYVPLHVFVPIMEAIAAGTGDQDVLMELDWSTLRISDGDIETEAPTVQSPAIDYTDAATGVKISAGKGVFEEGVEIVVTEITSGTDYDKSELALSDIGEKFRLYDVKFFDKEGSEAAPNGTITISFPVPNGYDSEKLAVYRINEDGSKTLVRGEVDGDYYSVVTKTAALYGIVESGSTAHDISAGVNEDNVNNGGDSNTYDENKNDSASGSNASAPVTGDTANIGLWFMLMAASACVIVMMNRKKLVLKR